IRVSLGTGVRACALPISLGLAGGGAADLAHALGDEVEAVHVRLRHAAARGVHRQAPVGPLDGAVAREVGALATLAESVALERERSEERRVGRRAGGRDRT